MHPVATSRQGIAILCASVMPIMAIVSLVPVLPLMQREFAGVAGAEFLVPIALTVPALCVAVFSPVAGWLADRLGRKTLLVTALLAYAAFGIVPWFLDSLPQIIAARIALGLVEAIIMTLATVLIGDYFTGAEREKWIALQIALGGIAATVLIAFGGVLGDMFGARGPFLLYLLALPVALTAALVLFEPARDAAVMNGSDAVFPWATVLPLLGATLGVGIIFYTINVKLGPVLELSGPVSPGAIGLVGALCNAAIGLGSFLFHRLKNITAARLLAFALSVCAIGYGGLGISASFEQIAASAVVACIGAGIALPTVLGWMMENIPVAARGRGMGLWTGTFFLAQFVSPLLFGAVAALLASPALALLAIGGCAAIGAAGALALNLRVQA